MSKALRPIFWHQGLFLQPQHFQHLEASWQAQQGAVNGLMSPHPWGVVRLELDDTALSVLQLRFKALSFITRDGQYISFPDNAVLESRTIDFERLTTGVTVYVGLRREQPGQSNVQVLPILNEAVTALHRFVASADPVALADTYAHGPEAQVSLMNYGLRLFWDYELGASADYDVMPVLRLEQDGDQIRRSSHYVAPVVNLASSAALQDQLRQVRDEIVGRARQLEMFKPTSLAKTPDLDVQHMSLLMALSVLNRYGAELTHLLELPQSHPWQCYGVLRQLVGELSTFSDRYDLLGTTRDGVQHVPAYQHEGIYASFSATHRVIRELLNEIAAAPEMLVRFELMDIEAGLYQAILPQGFFGKRHRYHLLAYGDDAERLTQNMRDAKLAAPEVIEQLVQHALSGVEMMALSEAPRGIPRRSGALYFYIDPLSSAWSVIEEAHEAVIFVPQGSEQLHLELIVSKW